MEKMGSLTIFMLFLIFGQILTLPEPGKWENQVFEQDFLFFKKNVFNKTTVEVKVNCENDKQDYEIEWMLRFTPCAQEYTVFNTDNPGQVAEMYLKEIHEEEVQLYTTFKYPAIEYMSGVETIPCSSVKGSTKHYISGNGELHIKTVKEAKKETKKDEDGSTPAKQGGGEAQQPESGGQSQNDTQAAGGKKKPGASGSPRAARSVHRQKREDAAPKNNGTAQPPVTAAPKPTTPKNNATVGPNPKALSKNEKVGTVWRSGYYVLILRLTAVKEAKKDLRVTVLIHNKDVGYISATDWSLLVFYGVMGLVYIFYGLLWLVLLACNWRDLMRLQYWIGAVIVLGMLEKAVFYADYQSVASEGQSVTKGMVIVAEVVSCLKRALARMLVIIVSVGFGIVKPRLGPTFHRLLFAGGLYFVLATVEGTMRALRDKGDMSNDQMIAAIPLAIVDATICWWIFSSLVQTTRQLRLRRNVIKLSLYRRFTNTLILAVVAAVIFMIWSIIQVRMKDCITNWHDLWIDEVFWHLLFSVILAIIMFLWKPSSNNQRYAFSPLIDAGDDDDEEEDETPIHDAFDVKSRKKAANGSPRQKSNSIEEDLKWVEENIPATLSDKASAFIESDEEVETVKYEMSKMQ